MSFNNQSNSRFRISPGQWQATLFFFFLFSSPSLIVRNVFRNQRNGYLFTLSKNQPDSRCRVGPLHPHLHAGRKKKSIGITPDSGGLLRTFPKRGVFASSRHILRDIAARTVSLFWPSLTVDIFWAESCESLLEIFARLLAHTNVSLWAEISNNCQ